MSSSRGGNREGAGRKSAWKNGETQTIRVPKALVSQLLEIARRLDNGESIDFVTKSKKKRDSVAKSKPKQVDSVTNSDGALQPLSCRALARRLGVSDTAIMAHRDGKVPPAIPEWTQSKDSDGVAWEYREEAKKYYPITL